MEELLQLKTMGRSKSIVGAQAPIIDEPDKSQGITIDLYFGVFFDGTNNNKLQSMVGLYFRRKQIYEKHKKELKKIGVKCLPDLATKPRSYWEDKEIFNRSELDRLYGASAIISNDMEKSIMHEDSELQWSSVTEDASDKKIIKKKLERISEAYNAKKGFSITDWVPDNLLKNFTSQNSTYTNVAILNSLYKVSKKDNEYHYSIYIEGSGADTTNTVVGNVSQFKNEVVGLGFGVGSTGVAAKCKRVANIIYNKYIEFYSRQDVAEIRFHFDIFGFSRGATTARLFTYVINPDNKNKMYKITERDYDLFTGHKLSFLPTKKEKSNSKISLKEVRKLGIFDTVSSIGILRDPLNEVVSDSIKLRDTEECDKYGKSMYHDSNVDDYGLYATEKTNDVLHICAMDECRINFALVDISNSLDKGTELFIPGCHTDIGGGGSLGLDSFKIINKDMISNKAEIIEDLREKIKLSQQIFKDGKNALVAAKSTIDGVKQSMNGIKMSTTVAGAIVGIPTALKGIANTYNGAKDLVIESNKAVHGLKDLLIEAENEASGEGEITRDIVPAEVDKAKRGTKFMEVVNDVLNINDKSNQIKDKSVKTYNNIQKGVNTLKSNDSTALEKLNASISMMDDITIGVEDVTILGNSILDSIKSIRESASELIEILKRKDRNAVIIQKISDSIEDLINDMKNTAMVAQDTCTTIKDIVNKKKKRWIVPPETKRIVLMDNYPCVDCTGKAAMLKPVNLENFKELGWIGQDVEAYPDDKKQIWGRINKEDRDGDETIVVENTKRLGGTVANLGLYKYVYPGYSNISLHAMHKWSGECFSELSEKIYPIPQELKHFSKAVDAATTQKGRIFCAPLYNDKYKELRCKYLHFSINQQFLSPADNQLVNGPTFVLKGNNAIVSRRIYIGKKNSSTAGTATTNPSDVKYLFDYNEMPQIIN